MNNGLPVKDSGVGSTPHQPIIMQIIPELGPGGAEQGCIDVASAIQSAGGKAIVVSHGGNRIHEVTRSGAVHINMPAHSKNPVTMWQNITRIKKLIKQHNVDIVHVRSRAPAWSAYKACKGTKARFMTTCHAPYNYKSKLKQFYNSAMAKGERVIAISQHVENYLRTGYGLNEQTMRLIHRGIPIERFHPTVVSPERMIALNKTWRIPESASVILLPGRLTRWKGQAVLIEAMAEIENKDVYAVLIGSDQGRSDYRKELEQLIEARGLSAQIRIVDHCNDMPAAYMLSTVVVSASTDPEGFGRIPVEAQAMGRPIIGTDHGGAQETILRGETGWLIPPANPHALANAIKEALSLNNSQRAVLATRAMAHVMQNFTKEIMTEKTLAVYAELLALDHGSNNVKADDQKAQLNNAA
jgi:glycosyltransferase involved in cell wall biosynthesis|tara:strand:+ start:180281 stop:181519 length:1239 start_codon:yes stop_codon:yes gene_type:complete